MSVAAETHTDGTPARLPKPGDVDWFLMPADRARAAKAIRDSVEAPTMWGKPQDDEQPRVVFVVTVRREERAA